MTIEWIGPAIFFLCVCFIVSGVIYIVAYERGWASGWDESKATLDEIDEILRNRGKR